MLDYIKLISLLKETNRPPGGTVQLKNMLDYVVKGQDSTGLDVGCNTGFCTFEAVRLKGVNMHGIDVSSSMIESANEILLSDNRDIKDKVEFSCANAKELPFIDDSFDFLFSGGSTVFIDDISKALSEYKRVIKPWAFVGDMNFFYRDKFPKDIVDTINDKLKINIKPWDEKWWVNTYENSDLELFHYEKFEVDTVDENRVIGYINELLEDFKGSKSDKEYIHRYKKDLVDLFLLFNENNKHLVGGNFYLRKRNSPVEKFLFNK